MEVFGSTRYGVDTDNSDLDLVVLVSFDPAKTALAQGSRSQDPDRILGFEPHIYRPKFPGMCHDILIYWVVLI